MDAQTGANIEQKVCRPVVVHIATHGRIQITAGCTQKPARTQTCQNLNLPEPTERLKLVIGYCTARPQEESQEEAAGGLVSAFVIEKPQKKTGWLLLFLLHSVRVFSVNVVAFLRELTVLRRPIDSATLIQSYLLAKTESPCDQLAHLKWAQQQKIIVWRSLLSPIHWAPVSILSPFTEYCLFTYCIRSILTTRSTLGRCTVVSRVTSSLRSDINIFDPKPHTDANC